MGERSYTLRKRAQTQDATRQRIVEATMQLHEEVGPRSTTVSAVAERAGVQRLTVYRHFPDETALFQACTSHWLSLNPLPDPAAWAGIEDGAARCRAALAALYGYYRGTERMWIAAYRDEAEVAALQAPMQQVREYLAAVARGLADAPAPRASQRRGAMKEVTATVEHTVQFATWASLSRLGLTDAEAARLAARWVEAAREGGPRRPGRDPLRKAIAP